VSPDELLGRLARTLRSEVGPAVANDYARTQAFLAAVVLEKLAGQLACEAAHLEARAADWTSLVRDLGASLAAPDAATGEPPVPGALADSVAALEQGGPEGMQAGLGRVVEALYRTRGSLGDREFEKLLARVRQTLRADLDRRLEYAR